MPDTFTYKSVHVQKKLFKLEYWFEQTYLRQSEKEREQSSCFLLLLCTHIFFFHDEFYIPHIIGTFAVFFTYV